MDESTVGDGFTSGSVPVGIEWALSALGWVSERTWDSWDVVFEPSFWARGTGVLSSEARFARSVTSLVRLGFPFVEFALVEQFSLVDFVDTDELTSVVLLVVSGVTAGASVSI